MNEDLRARKLEVIEQIRESYFEDNVIRYYKSFLEQFNERLTEKTTTAKKKGEMQELHEILEQVTLEAARRISDRTGRVLLLKTLEEYGKSYGFETKSVVLPFYEDDTGESRKWKDKDEEFLGEVISNICNAIIEICRWRADNGFTKFDLCRNVPEISPLIDPFLKMFGRMGFIVFRYFTFREKSDRSMSVLIYLDETLPSAELLYQEVIQKLKSDFEIPYSVLRTVKCYQNLEKQERIVKDVRKST